MKPGPVFTANKPKIELLGVVLLALLIIFITAWTNKGLLKDFRFVFFGTNDQINYLTTARNLLTKGDLDSNIIYIGSLDQPHSKNTLYMPGYSFILATVFRLLGYGVIQALLPSFAAYVAGAALMFLIAWESFGRRAAWFSTLMFLFYPFHLVYTFTTMMEMVFVALSLGVFYIFMQIKPRLRWIAGPVLVILPFLVRETAALLVIPMAGLILFPDWQKSWKEALAFCILTFGVLFVVYLSPLSSGRISLFSSLSGAALYDDIGIGKSFSLLELPRMMVSRALDNIASSYLKPIEFVGLAIMLNGIQSAWFTGLLKKKLDLFTVLSTIFFLSMLTIVLFLYELPSYRGIRTLLFTVPFTLAGWGMFFSELTYQFTGKLKILPWMLGLVCLSICLGLSVQSINEFADKKSARSEHLSIDFFESLHHDDQKVMVADYSISFPYVEEHYPVKFAFIPVSRAGMEKLMSQYDVGTVVYPAKMIGEGRLSPQDLSNLGFILKQRVEFMGQKYLVFHLGSR